ncbi:pyrroloquinoline quinone biosynthesis peptide chaperone PqqD [Streptomyces kunmingensis]|uniref:Pyrroloquinoline quinone biosynthesis peptide chaperone PqqD n=1 Tax=Streptomyces kunmingensis TaxID=68225 RepID=A0ABU6CEQ3_9ACTN|nr:pyrroloquinoline quinone biosynthesis peptide chaperone PqqD [Streptomyces kunmingensis]MEB3963176.1 pyrroloquinoline quinone biosynthesis peptide chaperone PqqD [Streptomyces kunmingensis]
MNGSGPWRPRVHSAAVLRHDPTRRVDVLLLPERVIVLHGTGRAVLERCDGRRTVAEIAETFTAEAGAGRAQREIASFLERLRTEGCLR